VVFALSGKWIKTLERNFLFDQTIKIVSRQALDKQRRGFDVSTKRLKRLTPRLGAKEVIKWRLGICNSAR